MKRVLIAAVFSVLGVLVAGLSLAQGRHDEKPHGSGKPAAESTAVERTPAWGGRHDERPHGPRKPVLKKDAAKAGENADKGGK